MKKGIISVAVAFSILFLACSFTIFAAVKKEVNKQVYSVERIVTFSGYSNMKEAAKANAGVDKKVNDFLKERPDIIIIDRKMSTAGAGTYSDPNYSVTVTIFYKIPLKSN